MFDVILTHPVYFSGENKQDDIEMLYFFKYFLPIDSEKILDQKNFLSN